ncbi:unnamed protein product [Moneuplotes crassus]|uniref:Sulfotransferase domain-containing protein n=1 Tax=Euplotes crassus TaxID=5936 RepID=A0AAD1UE11_EUPCR|nr:unnamed protein product [Moneuplotes crassus]
MICRHNHSSSQSMINDDDHHPEINEIIPYQSHVNFHPAKALSSPKVYLEKAKDHYLLKSGRRLLSTKNKAVRTNFSKIALVSYPGSGEAFLRESLEETTKIFTADDAEHEYKMSPKISNAWIINTHFPLQKAQKFKAKKAIVLIRDPLETIVESKKKVFLSDINSQASVRLEKFESSDSLDAKKLEKWARFYEYWIDPKRECLTYFVKYSDLVKDLPKVMKDLCCFLIGCQKKDLKGSVLEKLCNSKIIHASRHLTPPSCSLSYSTNAHLLSTPGITKILNFTGRLHPRIVLPLRMSFCPNPCSDAEILQESAASAAVRTSVQGTHCNNRV